jgi:hypothetical protein
MKPLRSPAQLSQRQTSSAQPALFESQSPVESKPSGTFDWKLDRPAPPKRDVSVLKAVATSPASDAGDAGVNGTRDADSVTTIRLTVGESVDTKWRNSDVRQASPEEATSGSTGWTRAKK